MKTTHYIPKFTATLAVVSALIVAIGLSQASLAQNKAAKTQAPIGVYDSRSIAVAFAGKHKPIPIEQAERIKD